MILGAPRGAALKIWRQSPYPFSSYKLTYIHTHKAPYIYRVTQKLHISMLDVKLIWLCEISTKFYNFWQTYT